MLNLQQLELLQLKPPIIKTKELFLIPNMTQDTYRINVEFVMVFYTNRLHALRE